MERRSKSRGIRIVALSFVLSRICCTVLLVLAVVLTAFLSSVVYGQQDSGMRGSLPEAKLDILLEPEWEQDRKAKFTVSFLQRGTDIVQPHIDYDFVVEKASSLGAQTENSAPTCQAVLHTAEGVVTIPCQFQENGDYLVEVSVYGVLFTPVDPESVTFPIKVTPEFPAGSLASLIAVTAASVTLKRTLKKLRGTRSY